MFTQIRCYTRYARYALTALTSVAFGLGIN
jgi:hypothetical protein